MDSARWKQIENVVQDSLAANRASYCFRMVQSDGTALTAYNFYPTLKTIGYGVESKNWRWYDDAQNATPATTLAAETVTPINISYNNAIALRLTLRESQGAAGSNIKFKLQYSESPSQGPRPRARLATTRSSPHR